MAYNSKSMDAAKIAEIKPEKEDFFDWSVIDINSKYPKETIVKVATTYLIEGSVPKVSKLVNIPNTTIYEWMNSHWWIDLMKEVRRQKQDELDALLTNTLHMAVDGIIDRLASGEYKVDKDGSISRVPASLRDLSMTTGVIFDKRALIRGDATSMSGKAANNDETLKKLEERFVAFAKKMEDNGKKSKSSITNLERVG